MYCMRVIIIMLYWENDSLVRLSKGIVERKVTKYYVFY